MPDLVLTRLDLTQLGARLNRREWHTFLACHADQAGSRILWSWPSPGMILAQCGSSIDADLFPGLVSRSWSASVRTKWVADSLVRLSLIGNPIKQNHSGPRAIKTPLPPEQWQGWLCRKLEGVVRLCEVATEPLRPIRLRKSGETVTISLAGFYATGTVEDPSRLAELISGGVGAGKAYGAGLLLVGEL